MEVKAGFKIFNKNNKEDATGNINYGTLGGIVYDSNTDEKRIITCFHSVMPKDNPMDWGKNDLVCTLINGETKELGNIIEAKLTDKLDIAIIKPNKNITLNQDINNMGEYLACRPIGELNSGSTKVWKYGASSGYSEGLFNDIDSSEYICYPDGEKHELRWLIKIRNLKDKKAFSKSGDSGSFILDYNRNLIGVLVARNTSNTTFVIRASYISEYFNIKF